MVDLEREMVRLRKGFAATWSDTRQKAVEKALLRRHGGEARSLRTRRMVLGAAMATLIAGLVYWRASAWLPPRREQVSAPSTLSGSLVLSDGSSVTPDRDTDVRWAEVSPTKVTAVLRKGRARFDVLHSDARVFQVEAGPIAVQALGTAFDVERTDDVHSRVTVNRGRVRVFWAGGTGDLGAGEGGVFPPAGASTPGPLPSPPASGPAAVAEALAPSSHSASLPTPHPPGWRSLAETGEFEQAYDALAREGGSTTVRGDVSELLLASDVARLSHHPIDAVDPLKRILLQATDDPRASLAAFTLGRVYLESLGQPREAAIAFAQCRALAPRAELAPDALAREVEARATGGETEIARTLAAEYVRDYPNGTRTRSVRRYGGLE